MNFFPQRVITAAEMAEQMALSDVSLESFNAALLAADLVDLMQRRKNLEAIVKIQGVQREDPDLMRHVILLMLNLLVRHETAGQLAK